jgi:Spy/CpxP family protein refolding chaperone
MNRALKWKLLAGFILVFIAGGITGAILGGVYARHLLVEAHRPGLLAARMKERLRKDLNLTPQQMAQVSPIIDKAAAQLRAVRRDTGRRVRQIIEEAHRQMAANLTDEQRRTLKQIEERRGRWHSRHGHHVEQWRSQHSPEPSATP